MNSKTKKIVGIGLFTAIVLVLQFLGGGIKFGMFSISLVLVPIVVGAAVYGWQAGGWLGFVFGVAVLLSGDAAAFLAVDVFGTILTVLVKGTAAGLCTGLVYRAMHGLLNKYSKSRVQMMKTKFGLGECCETAAYDFISRNNKYLAVLIAAIVCPVVNTGVFLLGCQLFFLPTIREWAAMYGYENVGTYMILGLAGINFLIELGVNLVLGPMITQLIKLGKK